MGVPTLEARLGCLLCLALWGADEGGEGGGWLAVSVLPGPPGEPSRALLLALATMPACCICICCCCSACAASSATSRVVACGWQHNRHGSVSGRHWAGLQLLALDM